MSIRKYVKEESSWPSSASWSKKIERYGEEKNLDIDVVINMNSEIHAGINLNRWRTNPAVKAKVIAARKALGELNEVMVDDFWASVDPKHR